MGNGQELSSFLPTHSKPVAGKTGTAWLRDQAVVSLFLRPGQDFFYFLPHPIKFQHFFFTLHVNSLWLSGSSEGSGCPESPARTTPPTGVAGKCPPTSPRSGRFEVPALKPGQCPIYPRVRNRPNAVRHQFFLLRCDAFHRTAAAKPTRDSWKERPLLLRSQPGIRGPPGNYFILWAPTLWKS